MGNFSTFDTENFLDNQRETLFKFYATNGLNGKLNESITMGKPWKLKEIRVHCSSAFASQEHFVVSFSSIMGSMYNMKLVSYSMSDLTDLWIDYVDPLPFESDDHMLIAFSTTSGANRIGLTVIGWAVVG